MTTKRTPRRVIGEDEVYGKVAPKPGGTVVANTLRETSGPTDLPIGAWPDGKFLKRVGSTIVGADAGGGGAASGAKVSNIDVHLGSPATGPVIQEMLFPQILWDTDGYVSDDGTYTLLTAPSDGLYLVSLGATVYFSVDPGDNQVALILENYNGVDNESQALILVASLKGDGVFSNAVFSAQGSISFPLRLHAGQYVRARVKAAWTNAADMYVTTDGGYDNGFSIVRLGGYPVTPP